MEKVNESLVHEWSRIGFKGLTKERASELEEALQSLIAFNVSFQRTNKLEENDKA